FAQVLLADEINRASPKTQSALLEAMEEKQVSVEGATRPLPHPFFVIATQNPQDQLGTFALPESQLDRFLMRISIG
ncbi:ATPase AAA, partial [Acidovorax temperans]